MGSLFYGMYALRVFKSPVSPKFWYREAYCAIIATFGIILNQTYKSKRLNPLNVMRDDNVHYILIATLWLFSNPDFTTLIPFLVFAIFHVLTYARQYLLPALGHGPDSLLSLQISNFVKTYNDMGMMLAANAEFFLLLKLGFQFLTFRKGTAFRFLIYLVFFKLRFDQSIFTKTVIKNFEMRIDTLLSHPSLPPVVKQMWISVKDLIRRGMEAISIPTAMPQRQTAPAPSASTSNSTSTSTSSARS